MKKTYLYLGLVVVLAAIGWLAYKYSAKPSTGNTDQTISGANSSGSLTSLLASSTPQECSFSTQDAAGTIYVAANRLHSDFMAQSENDKQSGHMIVKDDTAYVWIDGQAQGFSMSTKGSTSASEMPLNLNDKVDYSCKAWRADEAKFTTPSNITFTDYSDMLKQLQGGNLDLSKLGL